jgi:hypothetical protein
VRNVFALRYQFEVPQTVIPTVAIAMVDLKFCWDLTTGVPPHNSMSKRGVLHSIERNADAPVSVRPEQISPPRFDLPPAAGTCSRAHPPDDPSPVDGEGAIRYAGQ